MSRLYVDVRDANRQPIPNVGVAWSTDEQSTETSGQFIDAESRFRLDDVPPSTAFVVHLTRVGAPDLWVKLDLDESGDRPFPRGKPTVMQLVRQRVRGVWQDPCLHVTWYQPQEVIVCAGKDIHHGRRSVFPGIAIRRFARMVRLNPSAPRQGVLQVNRSCVLSLFEFNGSSSRIHHLLAGRGTRDVPGYGSRIGPAVLMKTVNPPGDRLSITDVYDYIERIGRSSSRRQTIMALEFAAHAYWGGPVLENTHRRCRIRSEQQNCAIVSDYCKDICPCGTSHHGMFQRMPPQAQLPLFRPDRFDCSSCAAIVATSPLPNSAAHTQRDPQDLDPRNTDFSTGLMSAERIEALRSAFHADAINRVWGCNNGDMGPRWRAAVGHLRNGGNNELITVRSNKAGSHPYRQIWRVRRGDARLHYYSQAHRSYAQALASALQRPCYAAVPGTWAWYQPSDRLGGMTVHSGTYSRMRSYVSSLANFADSDEARYFRFEPSPTPYQISLKVLVAGFVRFRRANGTFMRTNSAQEAVSRLPDIRASLDLPSWIDLNLVVRTEPDVDVVWTAPAPCVAEADAPSRPSDLIAEHRGSEALLQIARDNFDLVIGVGGSVNVLNANKDIRVELFARNHGIGSTRLLDNDGRRLTATGEIFPGRPGVLESTVPRQVWAHSLAALTQNGFRVWIPRGEFQVYGQPYTLRNSAGNFICNETFYRLLLDARQAENSRHPSGRWVSFAHIAALDETASSATNEERTRQLARALAVLTKTLVEEMLWAREPYGRLVPSDPDGIPCSN
jgi:hypothetical protein